MGRLIRVKRSPWACSARSESKCGVQCARSQFPRHKAFRVLVAGKRETMAPAWSQPMKAERRPRCWLFPTRTHHPLLSAPLFFTSFSSLQRHALLLVCRQREPRRHHLTRRRGSHAGRRAQAHLRRDQHPGGAGHGQQEDQERLHLARHRAPRAHHQDAQGE